MWRPPPPAPGPAAAGRVASPPARPAAAATSRRWWPPSTRCSTSPSGSSATTPTVTNLTAARRGAARPRALAASGGRGSPAPSVVFYEKGLQPAVDEAVSNDGSRARRRRRRRGRPARGADGEHRPALLAGPHAPRRGRDGVHRGDERGRPRRTPRTSRPATRRLQADLRELDEEYRAGLADCDDADRRGQPRRVRLPRRALRPRRARDRRALPRRRALARRTSAELGDLIREDGITTVFSETPGQPRAWRRRSPPTSGIDTAVLDPIEGLTSDKDEDDYLSLMRANLQALGKAGGCR